MIGYLRGTLVEKQPPRVVIDVGGIGYELAMPLSGFWKIPELNQSLLIYTQLIVREDAHTLYGFSSVLEKNFFNQLLRINGVGPKMALAILSGLTVEACHQAVMAQDIRALTVIPGVGKKTAERLMIELRDKMGAFASTTLTAPQRIQQEALEALVALGYTHKEAQKAVMGMGDIGEDSMSLLKRTLQKLGAS